MIYFNICILRVQWSRKILILDILIFLIWHTHVLRILYICLIDNFHKSSNWDKTWFAIYRYEVQQWELWCKLHIELYVNYIVKYKYIQITATPAMISNNNYRLHKIIANDWFVKIKFRLFILWRFIPMLFSLFCSFLFYFFILHNVYSQETQLRSYVSAGFSPIQINTINEVNLIAN